MFDWIMSYTCVTVSGVCFLTGCFSLVDALG